MRTGDETMSLVRRATRRRAARRLIGAGTGAAGLTVLVAAAMITPGFVAGSTRAGTSGGLADPAATERVPDMVAAAQTTLPDLPTAEQATAHGNQIYRILFGAVPAGYRAERRFDDSQPSSWFFAGTNGKNAWYGGAKSIPETARYVAMADLLLRAGGREGEFAASVWGDRKPAPVGDLCSAEVDARMDPIFGAAGSCQVITIGGLPMRVTTYHDPEQLAVIYATWFVRSGFVTVSSRQGLPRYQADPQPPPDAPNSGDRLPAYRPPLEHPVVTPQQLANIAANPGLLP